MLGFPNGPTGRKKEKEKREKKKRPADRNTVLQSQTARSAVFAAS